MKIKELKVNNIEEFQELVNNQHFGISQAIVGAILDNIKTRKKNIPVLAVKCIQENNVFDITLERVDFIDTLKENIKHFEKREMFEECAKISNAIKELSEA